MRSRAAAGARVGRFHKVPRSLGRLPDHRPQGARRPRLRHRLVGLIGLLAEMNDGLPDARKPDVRLDRTDFFLGCVVTNHKRHEREVMPQYFKLRKKALAGARFVINQIGWDVRKDDELLRWIRREGVGLHALANVYLLSRPAAAPSTRGRSPGSSSPTGCSSWPSTTAPARTRVAGSSSISRQAPRGGPRPRLRRRVPRGPHAGRNVRRDRRPRNGFAPDDWRSFVPQLRYPFDDEFYLFEPEPGSGLSSDTVSGVPGVEATATDRSACAVQVPHRRRMRDSVFAPGALLSRPAERYRGPKAPRAARRPTRGRAGGEGVALRLPRLRRLLLARDRLRLPRVACAKNQRNGPAADARGSLRGLRHRCIGRRRTSG